MASRLARCGHIYSQQQAKDNRIAPNDRGVNTIIALDPASSFNISPGSPIGDIGGYDVDGRSPAYTNVHRPIITIYIPNPGLGKPPTPLPLISPFETRTLVSENLNPFKMYHVFREPSLVRQASLETKN